MGFSKILQPTDETATITRSTDGTSTNDTTVPSFSSILVKQIKLRYTWSTSVSMDASAGGAGSAFARIKYSINGGSSFSTLQTTFVTVITPNTDSAGDSGTLTEAIITGRFNLDQLLLRAEAELNLTAPATGSATATVTDWEVEYLLPPAGMIEG